MKIDTSAIKRYKGQVLINGTQCSSNEIDSTLSNINGAVQIELLPGVVQPEQQDLYCIVVQHWMTQLSGLYNFHMSKNGGKVMPFTAMYVQNIKDLGTLYYAQLYKGNVKWEGYIPKSAITYLGTYNE